MGGVFAVGLGGELILLQVEVKSTALMRRCAALMNGGAVSRDVCNNSDEAHLKSATRMRVRITAQNNSKRRYHTQAHVQQLDARPT